MPKEIPVRSKAKFEASRPTNEQKIEFDGYVVRAYLDESNNLHVLCHKRDKDGNEILPLGYVLGRSVCICKAI